MAVVFHHSVLTFPGLAGVQYGGPAAGAWQELWSYTPLRMLWAGPEAVVLFFVLSGFVLSGPVARSARFAWRRYYPSRLVRLYLPVSVALGFAVLAHQVTSRLGTPEGLWLMARDRSPTTQRVVEDLVLLHGNSGVLSPLWSLRWEIWFSLLLPGFALLLRGRTPGVFAAVLSLLASAFGVYAGAPALIYLPVFAVGVLTFRWYATRADSLHLRERQGALVLLGCAVLFSARWLAEPFSTGRLTEAVLFPTVVIGATGMMVLALVWPPAIRVLSRPASQALGAVSFSLYLVHEPIVILSARLNGGATPMTFVVGVAGSLVAAWCFLSLVERPSHRLARRISAGT